MDDEGGERAVNTRLWRTRRNLDLAVASVTGSSLAFSEFLCLGFFDRLHEALAVSSRVANSTLPISSCGDIFFFFFVSALFCRLLWKTKILTFSDFFF